MPPNQSTLRGASNNVATKVDPCEPWTFLPQIPEEALKDKKTYASWRGMPTTAHLVYGAAEGINPGIRCSKHNPLRKLHGLIADFDAKVSDTDFDTILDRCPADLRPTWITRTMHSGGARLIWMFEEPLPMEQGELTKQFLKIAFQALLLNKVFAGVDEPAWGDLFKLYDVGRDWRKLGDYTLSNNLLQYWLVQASKKMQWGSIGEIHIPIEAVAEEVERQFPGRWSGPFEVERRGVAFFNPASQNPTAAIVTEAGMICFGEDQLFHSWSKIFGGAFVRQFQQDKIGAAVAKVWYDGKNYFRKSTYGVWEPHSKEDFAAHLKVRHGIECQRNKKDTASELDMTLVYVHENRRVTGLIPQVYNPEDLIYFNNKRFLNCAAVTCMQPVDIEQEWGAMFPWLAQFIDTCFEPGLVPCVARGRAPMDAKTIFLTWWKRFYCSALAGRLLKGQALFLAGTVGIGKTLLSAKIVAGSMGGAADASHFLNSDTNFNKELLEVGLWNVDDAVASQDPQAHLKFTEMVKRAVANPYFTFRALYKDGTRVEWHGRVLVTLNDDASSIRILPNLDSSIEDKIIVLKLAEAKREFPGWAEMDDIISSELPYLLRWLVDWKPPEEMMGNKRFGMHSYIHEALRIKSMHAGGVSDVLEINEVWQKRCAPEEEHGKEWQGSVSEWIAELSLDDALKSLVCKFTVKSLGRKFVEASRIEGSGISIIEGSSHGNRYSIKLDGDKSPTKRLKVVPKAE